MPDWETYTDTFKEIFLAQDVEGMQSVTYNITRYTYILVIVVFIGSLIVVSRLFEQVTKSLDLFRYA